MGQTLTHGIYLPDEGERNCYNGLAGNWSILDGAVGTIAEHTSALAGKAPLVHTHTVSQITDFPAYGNAAGTICEGNDSRLSDARTPVAHTHTKSDVTDLFNSANTWTDSNTFSKGCNIYNSDNSGSVAGLQLRSSKAEILPTTNVNSEQDIIFSDKNGFTCARVRCGVYPAAVSNRLLAATKDTNGNTVSTEIHIRAYRDGSKAVYPQSNSDVDLGTSTNKWKSFNSINPGALSLPDYSGADPIDFREWSTTGEIITYTPTLSGLMQITVSGGGGNYIKILDSGTSTRAGQRITGDGTDRLFLTHPVVANHTYRIYIVSSAIETARIVPCLGNV